MICSGWHCCYVSMCTFLFGGEGRSVSIFNICLPFFWQVEPQLSSWTTNLVHHCVFFGDNSQFQTNPNQHLTWPAVLMDSSRNDWFPMSLKCSWHSHLRETLQTTEALSAWHYTRRQYRNSRTWHSHPHVLLMFMFDVGKYSNPMDPMGKIWYNVLIVRQLLPGWTFWGGCNNPGPRSYQSCVGPMIETNQQELPAGAFSLRSQCSNFLFSPKRRKGDNGKDVTLSSVCFWLETSCY